MEGKDNIKELFSQKLGNYEAPVNPELWASISSQVAAAGTTTAASTGLSMLAKVAIGIGVSTAAIATVVVLSTSSESEKDTKNLPTTELQERTSELESTNTETNDTSSDNNEAQTAVLTAENTIDQEELEPSPEPIPQAETPTQHNEPVSSSETPINNMTPKGIHRIETPEDEPQIVPVVRYANVTNYGAEPENTEEYELEETESASAPKTAPIQRFVNVFTPNGDGENDEFFLESEGLTDFSVVVFNPAGDIVYKSDNPNFRWDGRDIRTNVIVPEGNYMYMVTAYDSEGNPYPIYERLEIKK